MRGLFRILQVGAIAALLASQPASAQEKESVLHVRGQEPFWSMRLAPDRIELDLPGQNIAFRSSTVTRDMKEGHPHFVAEGGGKRLSVTVLERLCADTMTGMPFPVAVVAEIDGISLSGCGGETMTVLEGGWRVTRLGESLAPQEAIITVVFGHDGSVSGRAGCNRYSGRYTLTAEGLSFGNMATTRMLCPEPVMAAERSFLEALRQVSHVTPGEGAQLRAMAGDRHLFALERAD